MSQLGPEAVQVSCFAPSVSLCIITNAGLLGQEQRRAYLSNLLSSLDSAGIPMADRQVIVAGAVGQPIHGATVLEHPEWAGTGQVCRLRNACAEAARGSVIIHCDDDILFARGYWRAVEIMLSGNWDILCTRLLNPNGTRYWDWAAYYPGKGQTLLPYDTEDPFIYATGGHALYRRRIFEKVRWNEARRHGENEEFDFAAHAREAGLKYACCPQATVFLQYPHCDAVAAVTASEPRPPEPPCAEYVQTMVAVAKTGQPPAPHHQDNERLLSRLGYKLKTADKEGYRAVDVSILVACHRYLQRFRVFATSILRQEIDLARVELIVSNPHSPDGLSSYLATLRQVAETSGGPAIREVLVDTCHRRNRGFLIQRAFEASQGAVVIGMDCDLVLPPDFLKVLTQTARENEDRILGVNRKFLTPRTTAKVLAGVLDPIRDFATLIQEDHEEPQGFRGVLGYCQALARNSWQETGYPEEFDHIAKSDVEFVQRLGHKGIHPLFLKDLCVLHLHHERDWNNGTQDFL